MLVMLDTTNMHPKQTGMCVMVSTTAPSHTQASGNCPHFSTSDPRHPALKHPAQAVQASGLPEEQIDLLCNSQLSGGWLCVGRALMGCGHSAAAGSSCTACTCIYASMTPTMPLAFGQAH